jgi:hypothetical protein
MLAFLVSVLYVLSRLHGPGVWTPVSLNLPCSHHRSSQHNAFDIYRWHFGDIPPLLTLAQSDICTGMPITGAQPVKSCWCLSPLASRRWPPRGIGLYRPPQRLTRLQGAALRAQPPPSTPRRRLIEVSMPSGLRGDDFMPYCLRETVPLQCLED